MTSAQAPFHWNIISLPLFYPKLAAIAVVGLTLLTGTGTPTAYAADVFKSDTASVLPTHMGTELKIEPASWWAGMHNPALQLLVYGENIKGYQVKLLDAKGIMLKSVETSSSQNHLFINLDLAHAQPQELTIGFYQNDQLKGTVQYPIQARQAHSRERQGFSNKDVIYLITPDRFANGNPGNDNHADMLEQANRQFDGGRHGGDIEGIRQALPYLQDLGITQLWINPLVENNQAEYSYHGYSATDFYRIDPRYGSNQSFKALVDEAKSHGIGVISDVVVNHIGANHHWMSDFPTDKWINGQAAWQQNPKDIMYTSHRRTTVQDPYAVATDSQGFTDGWFTDTMPDLNQTNPFLATYLIQNSIWWVEYAGLSGIREDTYSYADKDFLTQWTQAIMAEYPKFNIVGEEWTANPITVSYWQQGKANRDGYQSSLPSVMDFPLYETVIKTLNEPEGFDTGFINLYQALANDVVYAHPENLVLFEGNHDTNRLFSLMHDDVARTEMALAYVLTSNRIPQLFYGTEVLMQSPNEGRHDGAVRADFPGGWRGDKTNALTGEGLTEQQKSVQHFVKTLLNYRKHSQAIQSGALKHFVPENGIYVQMRCQQNPCTEHGADLMVIYNKNPQTVDLALARFNHLLGERDANGNKLARNVITGETLTLTESLTLTGQGVTLLELNLNNAQ